MAVANFQADCSSVGGVWADPFFFLGGCWQEGLRARRPRGLEGRGAPLQCGMMMVRKDKGRAVACISFQSRDFRGRFGQTDSFRHNNDAT